MGTCDTPTSVATPAPGVDLTTSESQPVIGCY
jgi:hypothetical protein